MSFEIHVTSEIRKSEYNPISHINRQSMFEAVAENYGWKTSMIDGDPVLGKGIKFYFTAHEKTLPKARRKLEELVKKIKEENWPLLRAKIEKIVFDEIYK